MRVGILEMRIARPAFFCNGDYCFKSVRNGIRARPTELKRIFQVNGGGGWIRTNVGLANGFTVRPL